MSAQKISDMPVVKVYGKHGCGLCDAAKGKLDMMGLKYEALDLGVYSEHHEGWREDNSCQVLAAYMLIDKLPVMEIDGSYMDYPSAMRELKTHKQEKRATVGAEN